MVHFFFIKHNRIKKNTLPKYVGWKLHDQLITSLQHSLHEIVKYFDNRNYSLCCVVTASVHDNLFKVYNIKIMQEKWGGQRLLEYSTIFRSSR